VDEVVEKGAWKMTKMIRGAEMVETREVTKRSSGGEGAGRSEY
jgi:hypothetical protein